MRIPAVLAPKTRAHRGAAPRGARHGPFRRVPAGDIFLARVAIFVNYRRDDSGAITGRIDDHLRESFGEDDVYRDIDSIPIGADFAEHLRQALSKCDVCIAVIGPRWASERLANEYDFVRLELETALARRVPIIPLLVEGATMPGREAVPATLHGVLGRQAASIDSGFEFRARMHQLVEAIKAIRAEAAIAQARRDSEARAEAAAKARASGDAPRESLTAATWTPPRLEAKGNARAEAIAAAQPSGWGAKLMRGRVIGVAAGVAALVVLLVSRPWVSKGPDTKVANTVTRADSPASSAGGDNALYKVPVGSSPALGQTDALVTMIEFCDYQSPSCVQVEPTLAGLREEYGDKLRFVWKDRILPTYTRAEPAAQIALEVRAEKGDAAFWEIHDRLLEGPQDLSDDTLIKLGTGLGANPARLRRALTEHTHQGLLDGERRVADDFGIDEIPCFFVNGRLIVGVQPLAVFENLIDAQVRTATMWSKAPWASGYDALTSGGRTTRSGPLPKQ